jgi:hypothetical protein
MNDKTKQNLELAGTAFTIILIFVLVCLAV